MNYRGDGVYSGCNFGAPFGENACYEEDGNWIRNLIVIIDFIVSVLSNSLISNLIIRPVQFTEISIFVHRLSSLRLYYRGDGAVGSLEGAKWAVYGQRVELQHSNLVLAGQLSQHLVRDTCKRSVSWGEHS